MAVRAVLVLVLLAVGVARAAEPPPPGRGHDHPLTGRIWDVARAQFITMDALVERLTPARFVLLGERHDNPDHHTFQAWIVRRLVADGRRPAVAFEMLSVEQATPLAEHLARSPRDAAGLGDAVGWSASGWPPWKQYEPIADAALAAGLPIVPANLAGGVARAVSRGHLAALDADLVRLHGLDRPAPPPTQTAMEAEMRDSHCGHLPETALPAMVTAQRARDAQMAERMIAAQRDGAVLIAGAGHVRTDRGVPTYLAARAPGASVASLAFVEVAGGRTAPGDYTEGFGGGRLPFDYVWFTVRADDVDPCAKFRGAGK
jgi:uncharacterized iron-regulated protein